MSFTEPTSLPARVAAFNSVFLNKKKNKAAVVIDLEGPAPLKFLVLHSVNLKDSAKVLCGQD